VQSKVARLLQQRVGFAVGGAAQQALAIGSPIEHFGLFARFGPALR
jgi:hypothetical protein